MLQTRVVTYRHALKRGANVRDFTGGEAVTGEVDDAQAACDESGVSTGMIGRGRALIDIFERTREQR